MEPSGQHVFEFLVNEFDKLTEKPEIYVEPQPEKTTGFKQLSEKSYDSVIKINKRCKGKFLPKLLIDGFDAEQVWQQCDLLNKALVSDISSSIHNINCGNLSQTLTKISKHSSSINAYEDNTSDENDKSISDNAYSDSEVIGQEKYAFDDDSDLPDDMEAIVSQKPQREIESKKKKLIKVQEDYAFDDDSDSDSLDDMEAIAREKPKKEIVSKKNKGFKVSEVDDQFFKLSEMEEFLKLEDLKEEKGLEHDSDEEDIDLFQDIPSDDMDDSDDDEIVHQEKPSKDIMYKDFFDDPNQEEKDIEDRLDDGDDNMDDFDENEIGENDEALFSGNNSDDGAKEDLETDNLNYKSDKTDLPKTAFELEQEKIRQKIQEYEKSMIEPLPWHLTGEVDVTKRPVDSLVHKETEFDSNVKEDLIVDKTLTEKIEEIVKKAIMNKAFNDVERKYKPTEDIMAYKKEVALEQTKSKKGLAEVYEEEYLKKQSKQGEDEEDPKHKEIKKLMDSLFPELYALFTHIPVPAIPEVKIVSNLPAVTVEEVAPIATSDATLLAPEEVKRKSGQIKSQTERTDTDRKRERRKKKIHQQLKEKKRLEKLESQKSDGSGKLTKLEKMQTLKKLKQHKNTKIATVDDGGKIKSSKDFFSRLQDTVDSKNRNKNQNSIRKKMK